jgi:hypothetical protein
MEDLVKRLLDAFDLVKEWPEKDPNGFMNLLALRNLVPEAAARIAELEAERDHAWDMVAKADAATARCAAESLEDKIRADRLAAMLKEAKEVLRDVVADENCWGVRAEALLARLEEG